MVQAVRKAVFPVAGLGTRFLPATKASPKEMLSVVDKPLIQYAVEEAYASGIREMIFITGRNKRSIEDHFDVAFELEASLEHNGKTALMQMLHEITPPDMDCLFIRQPRAMGLGHAVLCAASVIEGEPFAVLLADELTVSEKPALAQMLDVYYERSAPIVGLKSVAHEQTKNYGIVAGKDLGGGLIQIAEMVEKPSPDKAPSNLAISGRYILPPEIIDVLRNQAAGVGNEIQLTDALITLAKTRSIFGLEYEGTNYDCGSKLGFLQASVDIGMTHAETGEAFTAWLRSKF